MSGHSVLVVAIVFGILDHQTSVIGNLKPLHASDQLSPAHTGREREGGREREREREREGGREGERERGREREGGRVVSVKGGEWLTYDFPENMGPRMSCGEEVTLIETHQYTNVAKQYSEGEVEGERQ